MASIVKKREFYSVLSTGWAMCTLHMLLDYLVKHETLMSAKQVINDKLQSSVATYLRCGGVVNNQIKKGLLLSV